MMRRLFIEKIPLRRLGLIASIVASTATASPHGGFTATPDSAIRFRLPLPEGGETEFTLSDSGVLPPELASRYPEIRSLKGFDAEGREIRMDLSERGMRAVVFDIDGMWHVRPVHPQGMLQASADLHAKPPDNAYREYRIAVATTSAFTQFLGGTVSSGLAAVVESINRTNAIFERDLGIHLTLVNDNDRIVFADPSSDPYLPPPGQGEYDFERSQNMGVLNRTIGLGNYDVGHLFELSDAGGAVDGAVCRDDVKANASSGLLVDGDDPHMLSEDFISTVIHELGHQFGADHTFNGCERDSAFPYAPGSGSSIMSYAGECFMPGYPPAINPLHNLQGTKDAYFHAKSIEQIHSYVAGRGSCGIRKSKSVQASIVSTSLREDVLHIPARTPFTLEGHALSLVPQARLTYTWEQIDLGPEQMMNEMLSDKGQGPIFRSYPPTLHGTRTFPKLEAVLGEEAISAGEVYPATTRELNFRLTVRDNLPKDASTSSLDRKIQVVDTGEAFAVTYPSQKARWRGSQKRFVRWNVAGSDQDPISCRNVRVDLSIDGGHTYLPKPLLASARNTGRAVVDVPLLGRDVSGTRVRVGCNGNVFFAVSPGNFSIAK